MVAVENTAVIVSWLTGTTGERIITIRFILMSLAPCVIKFLIEWNRVGKFMVQLSYRGREFDLMQRHSSGLEAPTRYCVVEFDCLNPFYSRLIKPSPGRRGRVD